MHRALDFLGKTFNTLRKNITTKDLIVWGAPTLFIPGIRRIIDKETPNPIANKMFYRDELSYVVGSGTFLGTLVSANAILKSSNMKALKSLSPDKKGILANGIAMAVYIGTCTFGAVKLSDKIADSCAKRKSSPVKKSNESKPISCNTLRKIEKPANNKLLFTSTYRNFKGLNRI